MTDRSEEIFWEARRLCGVPDHEKAPALDAAIRAEMASGGDVVSVQRVLDRHLALLADVKAPGSR